MSSEQSRPSASGSTATPPSLRDRPCDHPRERRRGTGRRRETESRSRELPAAVTSAAPGAAQGSPPPPAAPSAAPRERMAWVDMARGFCVVAVVLVHVGVFHAFPLAGDLEGRPLVKAWVVFNSALLAELRMPLLLFVSGWLASTKVRAGLGNGRTRLAVLTNLHIYLVWTLIYVAMELLLAPGASPQVFSDVDSFGGFVRELLYPQFGPLWFVAVLAASIAVLSLLRGVPPPLVLLGLVVAGWVVERATETPVGLPRAVFFAAGVYLAPQVRRYVDSRRVVGWSAAAAAVFGAAMLLLPPLLRYPASVLACVPLSIVFLALAKFLCRWRAIEAPAAWIGRRTLGVYVIHWPLAGLLVIWGSQHPALVARWESNDLVAIAYPVVATAVVVALSLGLEALLKRAGLGILFEPPRRLREAVAGGYRPATRRRTEAGTSVRVDHGEAAGSS